MWELYYHEENWLTFKELKSFFSRFRGYMARDLDTVEAGLWLPDCSGIHTFFMRFPLDIYFLDGNHKILEARAGVSPARFVSHRLATSVLEIPAGRFPLAEVGESFSFKPCS
jgi:uncharacterized membrane protein (UPF0127 family)